jgi:phosphatidylglycerophosphatase A
LKAFIKLTASAFYIGYFRFASGTFASLFAVLPYLLMRGSWIVYLAVTVVLFFLGVYVSTEAEKLFNEKDPHKVVIDEVVGFFISMAFVPFGVAYVIAGFFLFRLFDVWKPYPMRQLQALPGGWGVMIDDVLAGIYTNIVLQIAVIVFKG